MWKIHDLIRTHNRSSLMLPFSDQNQRLSGLCSLHSDSNLTIQNCLGYGPPSRWDEETPLFHTQEHSTIGGYLFLSCFTGSLWIYSSSGRTVRRHTHGSSDGCRERSCGFGQLFFLLDSQCYVYLKDSLMKIGLSVSWSSRAMWNY